MEQSEAAARLHKWKDPLAHVVLIERSLAERRISGNVLLEDRLLDAVAQFEKVVSHAPHRQWLEQVAQQADIELDAVAHSVLALRTLMHQITADKVGYVLQSSGRKPDRFWPFALGCLIVLAVGLAYMIGSLQAH